MYASNRVLRVLVSWLFPLCAYGDKCKFIHEGADSDKDFEKAAITKLAEVLSEFIKKWMVQLVNGKW